MIWLVVLGFNATLTAKVISWRSVTHMCFLAVSHNFYFQSHQLLFSHASLEVRGGNTPERKVASTGDRTHNHQVMSTTRSPLSHPGGAHHNMKKLEEMRTGIGTINDVSSVAFLNFAHNNSKLDENGGEFSKRVENTMGAVEIAL